ncbi:MAG: hypothetical protein L6W00_26200 [Lentisphaeria bacterium]|nr:MAG: hypothetical protein L6W00_26200 [Lentisphaeria bacterium]
MLEEALLSYGGCLLVVSHDRYFLNRVCTGILTFDPGGKIVYTPGDYDYSLEKRRERRAAAEPVPVRETAKTSAAPPRSGARPGNSPSRRIVNSKEWRRRSPPPNRRSPKSRRASATPTF